jgi:hypothetical protein
MREIEDGKEVDPKEDCGTERCTYACEKYPFGIPEIVDNDSTHYEC